MHTWYEWGYGMMSGLGPVVMLLLWGLVIALIISAITALKKRRSPASPLDIAKQRYARGEISLEELQEIQRHL